MYNIFLKKEGTKIFFVVAAAAFLNFWNLNFSLGQWSLMGKKKVSFNFGLQHISHRIQGKQAKYRKIFILIITTVNPSSLE